MIHEAPNPAANSGSASAGHDPERERLAEILLEHCWELVSENLLARTAELFNDAVASAVRSGDETQVRSARTVALQIKTLLHGYRAILRTKFEDSAQALIGKRPSPAKAQSGLSLIELDESDLANELGQLTARLRNAVQVPFSALLQRLQTLAGSERELLESETPLRPGVFLEALSEDLATVISGHGELSALLRHFPGVLEAPLAATYEAINRFLDSKGIAPAAVVHRTLVKRAAGPPTIRVELPAALEALSAGTEPAPAEAAPAARAPSKAASAPRTVPRGAGALGGRHEASPTPEEQAMIEYGQLQALVGVNAGSLIEAAIAGARNAAAGREAAAVPVARQLLDAMLAAQRQDAEFLAARQRKPESGAEPDKGRLPEPLSTREQSVRLVALAAQPVHKLTIQLVARLFARIERDRLVAGPIRALLAFLRFPVLEVALAEPAVFVRRDHPLRRLIDAIGSSSIGWTPESAANRRYLQHVRAAVQFILHSPGEATSAFAQAADQFATTLAADRNLAEDPLAKAKGALQEAEEREIRAGEVSAFLGEILEGAHLEAYLRAFLLQVWARVLVEAAARDAQRPGLVRKLLGVVPDLVWSVQPLVQAADRKRLLDTIPIVLGALRDGLRLIHWPDARLHELLSHLMNAHSNALKGADATAATGSFSVSTVRIRLDGFRIEEVSNAPREGPVDVLDEAVHEVLAASGSGVSHQWVQGDDVPAFGPLDAVQAEQLLAGWQEKTWFDLRVGQSLARVRLEWFTPARSLALFSSSTDGALYSLSRESLITYLRCSWIAPAESAPLLERAFRTVLADLERSSRAAAEGADTDA